MTGALRLTFSACFLAASADFERTGTEVLNLVASSHLHPPTVLPLVSTAASTGCLAHLLDPFTLLTFSLLPLIFASCIAQFVLANCLRTCLIQNLQSPHFKIKNAYINVCILKHDCIHLAALFAFPSLHPFPPGLAILLEMFSSQYLFHLGVPILLQMFLQI